MLRTRSRSDKAGKENSSESKLHGGEYGCESEERGRADEDVQGKFIAELA